MVLWWIGFENFPTGDGVDARDEDLSVGSRVLSRSSTEEEPLVAVVESERGTLEATRETLVARPD